MRKFTDLVMAAAGTQDDVERGELRLEKGEKLMGIRCRFTVPVNNTSGGAVVLTDAQKRVLLALFTIETFDYGKSGKFAQPFVERNFQEMRRHQLRCYRNEMEGFTDTVSGLQRSLPNAATTNVTFTCIIPTGKWAAHKGKHRNRWGIGRSQAASVFFRIKRAAGANTILASVVISGSVTVDILDDCLPAKGDVWNPIPQLRKIDDQRIEFTLPEGLPLAIDELTAVHASSALNNISLKIDDQYIHRQIDLQKTIEQQLDADDYPAPALLSSEVTHVYETATGEVSLEELPTGTPTFRQDGTRQLNTVSFMYTYLPIDSAEKVAEMVRDVAVESRKKDILAISAQRTRADHLPVRLMPYAGIVLADRDDREFEQYPGLFASPNSPGLTAQPMIPNGTLDSAKSRVAVHKAAKEDKAATGVIDELVASIPGAVQAGRGFSKGNTATRSVIEQRYFR